MSKHTPELRDKLRKDYQDGDALGVVASRHGVSKSTASLWTRDLPRHTQVYKNRQPRTYHRRVAPHPFQTNTKLIGDITEAAVCYELLRRGLKVLKPVGDNLRYDLALDIDGRLIRIQCKTASEVTNGAVRVHLCSSYAHRGRGKKTYSGDVELIIAFCHETQEIFALHGNTLDQKLIHIRRQANPNGAPTKLWHSAGEFGLDAALSYFMDPMPNG